MKTALCAGLNQARFLTMNEIDNNGVALELIRRIQAGGGSHMNFSALERITGNPNVWMIFDAGELEGFSPEKILDLLGSHPQVTAFRKDWLVAWGSGGMREGAYEMRMED